MATIKAIRATVDQVVAGFAAGHRLAAQLLGTFEPAGAIELCRSIYGDSFALVQREKMVDGKKVKVTLTADQERDHSRYQAVSYAAGLVRASGAWPKKPRAAGAGKGKPGKGKGKPGKAGKGDGPVDGPAMLAGLVRAAKFADLLEVLLTVRKDAARLANGLAAGLAGEDDLAE